MNGELKILWGMTLIVISYAIYMTCSPDPADGAVLAGIVSAVVALVTGIATKTYVEYKALYPKGRQP